MRQNLAGYLLTRSRLRLDGTERTIQHPKITPARRKITPAKRNAILAAVNENKRVLILRAKLVKRYKCVAGGYRNRVTNFDDRLMLISQVMELLLRSGLNLNGAGETLPINLSFISRQA